MYKSQSIRQYEETGLSLRGNIENKLLAELSLNPNPDWGFMLSHYSNAFKQLDSLWTDMDPEFQFDLPTPVKVTPATSDIPQFLSTNIPPEDVHDITVADPTASHSLSDCEAIQRHNTQLADMLLAFNLQVEHVAKASIRSKPSNRRVDSAEVSERLKALR